MPTINGPSSVPSNGTASINGSGFTPNRGCLIQAVLNGAITGFQVQADSVGNFIFPFNPGTLGPYSPGETVSIFAVDTSQGANVNSNTITISITLLSSTNEGVIFYTDTGMLPISAKPGDSINVYGRNFSLGAQVQVRIDVSFPSSVPPIALITVQGPNFATSITIPPSTPGGNYILYALEATKGCSNLISLNVDPPTGTPPPTPSQTSTPTPAPSTTTFPITTNQLLLAGAIALVLAALFLF